MMPEPWLSFVAFPLAAYVVGSTPFGVLIARAKGVDLRAAGSGNVGATNVGRVIGRQWGLTCFALDVAKGLAPVLVAGVYLRRDGLTMAEQFAWLAVALPALLWHVLSFWLKFRGGKGVATSLGVLLGLWPYFTVPAVLGLALWAAVTLRWRYVSLGSIVAAAALPAMFVLECLVVPWWALAEVYPLLGFAIVAAGLVIVRHRTNIGRLLRGQENRIGRKKAGPTSP